MARSRSARLSTPSEIAASAAGDGRVAVDMGEARTLWDEIPLASEMDTLELDLSLGRLSAPVAVNIGNPHAVFFVDAAEEVDLASLGSNWVALS